MATIPRAKPYIWVTWLAGLLAGTQQCVWASWYKAHYKYDKRPETFDLAAWSADHDKLVRGYVEELEVNGWVVAVEKSNNFHLHGTLAIVAGQPDLIAKKQGQTIRIADGKTGEQSKRDWWQVLVYLTMVPMVWKQSGLRMHGEVFYKNGHHVSIEPEEVTPDRQQEIFALVRQLSKKDEPARTPSQSDCGRCDILACPDRWVEQPVEILTKEF